MTRARFLPRPYLLTVSLSYSLTLSPSKGEAEVAPYFPSVDGQVPCCSPSRSVRMNP